LAERIAPRLRSGDTVLLFGGLGSGKTHFARAIIASRLAAVGLYEDIPSPTYTLVQTYDDRLTEIWHCDLYRLTGPDEVVELGLADAFDSAICLVEWPEKLQDLTPSGALHLHFRMTAEPGVRILRVRSPSPRWAGLFATPGPEGDDV